MQGLITPLVLGSVGAVAIPFAVLLEWWSVRAVLALAVALMRPKPSGVVVARVRTGRFVTRAA